MLVVLVPKAFTSSDVSSWRLTRAATRWFTVAPPPYGVPRSGQLHTRASLPPARLHHMRYKMEFMNDPNRRKKSCLAGIHRLLRAVFWLWLTGFVVGL
ncbi:hypothetical protein BDW02DRAFT_566732 [Decorospora gaudefroyi]|uniref:Uncharacterized protein n=1 Tax=Decorospora gaudefroyi TaxID=184978 RepID=A0A6A5KF40_9PLEO|nr:hypothetical protein BDW02DRAFT_566732 [Decorospora gaudefroyi]